mmetsp:Transcript_17941/g.38510  ORF Transcript_17941/g.38510 Transcript_17941/m.38510 type:complete len:265 (+) Transcript_17941:2723-3517(+)
MHKATSRWLTLALPSILGMIRPTPSAALLITRLQRSSCAAAPPRLLTTGRWVCSSLRCWWVTRPSSHCPTTLGTPSGEHSLDVSMSPTSSPTARRTSSSSCFRSTPTSVWGQAGTEPTRSRGTGGSQGLTGQPSSRSVCPPPSVQGSAIRSTHQTSTTSTTVMLSPLQFPPTVQTSTHSGTYGSGLTSKPTTDWLRTGVRCVLIMHFLSVTVADSTLQRQAGWSSGIVVVSSPAGCMEQKLQVSENTKCLGPWLLGPSLTVHGC